MKPILLVASVVLIAATAPARLAAQDADGKAHYTELCKKCHGVLGTPPQTMKKKYSKIMTFDAKFLENHSEDSVVKVLTKGKGEDMESFKDKLSPAEMKAVAKYVRELAAKAKPGGED